MCGCSEKGIKTGGEYNVSLSSNPANLDPQMASDVSSYNVIRNIYATLVSIDNEGMIACDAAKDYFVSEDGLTYTFRLREGIMWTGLSAKENVPLTAGDFVFAYNRIMDPRTDSPHVELFSEISDIRAEDDTTLIIKINEPNCDFIKKLAHPAFSPCNEMLFKSTEGRYGLSAEDTYACGAFYISDWNYDPYWTDNHVSLSRIKANSMEGYITYPDTVNMLIDSDTVADVCLYGNEELPKGYQLSAPYYASVSVLVFTQADDKDALYCAACTAEDTSDEMHRRAYSFVPPSVTVMNQRYRDIFPDSRGYIREHANDSFRFDKEKFHAMLIGNDYTSYDTVNEITDRFANCGYYCDPLYLDTEEIEKRIGEGERDLYVCTIDMEMNSVDDLFAKLYSLSGKHLDPYLSSQPYVSAKAQYADQLEKLLINEHALLPLTYNSVYVMSRDDISGYWYDPFTKVFNYKYMIGEENK